MSTKGQVFLITSQYEDMNPQGVVPHAKAYIEPLQEASAKPKDVGTTKRTSFIPRDPPSLDPKVSSQITLVSVSQVQVARIMLDQDHVVLYRNSVGVFYCTSMSFMHTYPLLKI